MKRLAAKLAIVTFAFSTCGVLLGQPPALAQTSQGAPNPAPADAQGTISGQVVDTQTGLPLSNVRLSTNGPTTRLATTDTNGNFTIKGVPPGLYTLTAELSGYQRTLSTSFTVTADQVPQLTLALQRTSGAGNNLRVIATTSVSAAQSLQRSTVIYKSVSTENVINQGQYRIGDALINLPGINDGSSQTAAPADDLTIIFRGIGADGNALQLETSTLIDGHPIAYGLQGGYNMEISPPYAFRNVTAVYGTGASELYPVNAIGGVIDMQTLAPSPKSEINFTQQFGTWTQLGTGLTATGPIGHLGGYAAAASVFGQDGPFRGLTNYNSTASLDPGSPGYWQNTGVYPQGTATNTRTLLGKLVLNTNSVGGKLTLKGFSSNFYDDKTGNGDNDYLSYDQALIQAQGRVGNTYGASTLGSTGPNGSAPQPIYYTNPDPNAQQQVQIACPANLAPVISSANVPSGSYSNPGQPNKSLGVAPAPSAIQSPPPGFGMPTGAIPLTAACFTPEAAATQTYGWQGAGPAYQTFNVNDFSAAWSTPIAGGVFAFDGYTNMYKHHYDRSQQLPYIVEPGDNPGNVYTDILSNTGFTTSVSFAQYANTIQVGAWYNNDVYRELDGSTQLAQASTANDVSIFLRDVYRFEKVPISIFANLWQKYSSITNSSILDPRLAVVYSKPNDVFRISAGTTSTQPGIQSVNAPFQPGNPGGLLGNVKCGPGNVNSIGSSGSGSGPNSLKPETGVGSEFSYGHRFASDSIINVTLYHYNIYNFLASFTAPLSLTGVPPSSLLPTQTLNDFIGIVESQCGTSESYLDLLGINSPLNIGTLRAQGLTLSGSQRFIKHAIFDYDYEINSSVYVSAPDIVYQNQANLIQGSQIPNTPLHKWNVGLGYEFPQNINLHFGYHNVESNNPKNLPTYGFWDAQLNGQYRLAKLAIGVNNLFNQRADYRGLINEGYLQPGNSFASFEPQQTEQFSLPYRTITFTLTVGTH